MLLSTFDIADRTSAPCTGWRTTALLPLTEAARVAGVSRETLYNRARRGQLRLRKFGRKTLVETASLAILIDAAPDWRPGQTRVGGNAN